MQLSVTLNLSKTELILYLILICNTATESTQPTLTHLADTLPRSSPSSNKSAATSPSNKAVALIE